MEEKKAIVIGAGLVGSLWAVYLSKAGYKVTIYERRPDIRRAEISYRGWKALKEVGVDTEIEPIAIPMFGRMMHSLAGEQTFQPYGKEGQAIYSVSRGDLNAKMMDIAEQHGNAKIFYDHPCVDVDLDKGIVFLKNTNTGEVVQDKANIILTCNQL